MCNFQCKIINQHTIALQNTFCKWSWYETKSIVHFTKKGQSTPRLFVFNYQYTNKQSWIRWNSTIMNRYECPHIYMYTQIEKTNPKLNRGSFVEIIRGSYQPQSGKIYGFKFLENLILKFFLFTFITELFVTILLINGIQNRFTWKLWFYIHYIYYHLKRNFSLLCTYLSPRKGDHQFNWSKGPW